MVDADCKKMYINFASRASPRCLGPGLDRNLRKLFFIEFIQSVCQILFSLASFQDHNGTIEHERADMEILQAVDQPM